MTTVLNAQAVSTLIAPQLRRGGAIGCVHSVFRSALNVVVDAELVTIATPSSGALPNGVVLTAETDLRLLSLEPSATVWGEGERWRCTGVTIELAEAAAWSPVLEVRGAFPPSDEVRQVLAEVLRRRAVSGGFAEELARYAETGRTPRAMKEVVDGVRASDLEWAAAGARKLVGLGHGLTPSGDDALIGLCALLRGTGHPLHREFATACWRLACGRTTTVAEMFYRYAAQGAFSERLHRVLASLTTPGADLEPAIDRALDWGASSGADCLLGLLLGGVAVQMGGSGGCAG